MAEKHFTFGSNNLTLDANWSATRGGAGGAGKPASNDDVFIEARDTFAITTGMSGQAAVDLNSLTVSGPVTIDDGSGGITWAVSGTSGATAKFSNVTGFIRFTPGTNGCDLLDVKSTAGNGEVYVAGGVLTAWKTGRNAKLTIGTNATYTTGKSLGRTQIGYNSSGGTTLVINGGTCDCERSNATWKIGPRGSAKKIGAAAASTMIELHGKLTDHSYGTIASIEANPGSVATSKGSPYSTLTVTAAELSEGGSLFEDSTNVTFSAAVAVIGDASR